MTQNINTEALLKEALIVMDIIEIHGTAALPEYDDDRKWRRTDYVSCSAPGCWASTVVSGSEKAKAEVIIEDASSGVSVVLRSYRDADDNVKRIARWAYGSDENCGRELAEAKMEEDRIEAALEEPLQVAEEEKRQNLNQLIRDGLHVRYDEGGPDISYEEWDALRRTIYESSYPADVQVVHGEYETALYPNGDECGRVVAAWETATGCCRIDAPHKAAEEMAAWFANLIKNSLRYGWPNIND